MSLQAGETLNGGDYQVVRSLNQGRVGISYLAQRKGGDRVVFKTLRDDVLAQLTPDKRDKLNNKLINEAVRLARCHHPHIVCMFILFTAMSDAPWPIAFQLFSPMPPRAIAF